MAEVATLKLRIDSREAAKASTDLDRLGRSAKGAEKEAAGLTRAYQAVGRVFGVIAASVVAREVVQAADAYKNLNARLQLVSKSASDFTKAQTALFDISQRTRVGLGQTTDLYGSLARSTEALGVTQDELLKVTEGINQALLISGTSAQSAQAALVQLGQGFASGTLRGEELNSVLEQAPRLARALADGLGVPIGKLRELGKDGELTADKVFRALQKSSGALQSEFNRLPLTVEQATVQAGNSLTRLIGVIDGATGATSLLARALGGISRGIDGLANLPDTVRLGGLAKDLNNANTELKRLQALKISPFSQLVPDLDKQLAAAQAKFEAARRNFKVADGRLGVGSAGDQTSAEARRLGLLGPTAVPSFGKPDKPTRGARGGADKSVNEADQYLESLRQQLEATSQLSVQDALLRDIQLGRLGAVTPAQEQQLIAVAKQIDGFKALSDEQKRLEDEQTEATRKRNAVLEDGKRIYDETRTPLEALATETDRLNKLLSAGAIDWDTYARAIFAAQDRFDDLTDTAKKTGNDLDDFAKNALASIQSTLGDELADLLSGDFDDIGGSFKRVLNRMVADAIAADIAKAIGLGSGGSSGGFLDGLIKTGIGFLTGGRAIGGPVSAGGLYEVNERRPELLSVAGRQFLMMGDQPGNVSPNTGSQGQQLVVNQTINVLPGATRQTGMQAAADASRKLQQAQRNL